MPMCTAHAVLLSKPAQSDQFANPIWTIKDLQTRLKPMKRKENVAMPWKKPPLLTLYLRFVAEKCKRVTFDEGCDELIVVE